MKKHYIAGIIIFVLGIAFSTNVFAEGDVVRGKAKYKVCAACHGENGEGRKIANAPRISGQHSWYIARQLNNFKNNVRGTHINDITGMQMRPIAMTLGTDQDIDDVVAYVGSLNGRGKHSGVKGDIKKGKSAYAVCATCHGANGQGNEALNAPKIAGLPDWYVERQLNNFKRGIRGVHPKDIYGQQMRPMAIALLNDEAVRDMTVYVATLKSRSISKPVTVASSSKAVTNVQAPVSEPLYAPCASCHGSEGEGNQKLGAPRLAGQHAWYIERQLRNWRDGIRGTHSEDLYGIQMRPMAMTLVKDSDLEKVVSFIATLRGKPSKSILQGNGDSGKTSYATCIACHGLEGEGNKLLNAPKIAGLQDWYIARQLHSFKKGVRGSHEKDVYGMQMRPMAMALADDDTINNVALYVSTFKEKAQPAISQTAKISTAESASVSVTSSTENGKNLYGVCASCHGPDGGGNKALNAPRISGQKAWYVARQLANFKSGIRGSHEKDIYGQQMRPMSMTLANDQMIADVSDYVSTLKSPASSPTIKGDAAAGKAAYAICASCHGANGEGNKALNAPAIAGQNDWYIVRQLYNFKNGIRGADPKDTYGQQMRPMAMTLPNDAAINNIAAYISTLK
jgi:cytochrome c553